MSTQESAHIRPKRKRVKVALDLNSMAYCVVTVPEMLQLTNPMAYKLAHHYRRQIQSALDKAWKREQA